MGLYGLRIRGPYYGTIWPTLDVGSSTANGEFMKHRVIAVILEVDGQIDCIDTQIRR